MSKTKEEILLSNSMREVWDWILANQDIFDEEVGEHLNKLAKERHKRWSAEHGLSEDFLWTPPNLH